MVITVKRSFCCYFLWREGAKRTRRMNSKIMCGVRSTNKENELKNRVGRHANAWSRMLDSQNHVGNACFPQVLLLTFLHYVLFVLLVLWYQVLPVTLYFVTLCTFWTLLLLVCCWYPCLTVPHIPNVITKLHTVITLRELY